jgi:hypothetical protein
VSLRWRDRLADLPVAVRANRKSKSARILMPRSINHTTGR